MGRTSRFIIAYASPFADPPPVFWHRALSHMIGPLHAAEQALIVRTIAPTRWALGTINSLAGLSGAPAPGPGPVPDSRSAGRPGGAQPAVPDVAADAGCRALLLVARSSNTQLHRSAGVGEIHPCRHNRRPMAQVCPRVRSLRLPDQPDRRQRGRSATANVRGHGWR